MNDIEKRFKTKRILDILSNYFRVYTDEELALKLQTKKTSIANWRFFNKIPQKIIDDYSNIIQKNFPLVNDIKTDDNINIMEVIYYTPLEISEKLKIPVLDIISYIHDGSLKAYNFGNGNYRIAENQLNKFIINQEE